MRRERSVTSGILCPHSGSVAATRGTRGEDGENREKQGIGPSLVASFHSAPAFGPPHSPFRSRSGSLRFSDRLHSPVGLVTAARRVEG